MKIAYITTYPPRGQIHANTGGVASYTKNLISNTPFRKSDEVFVICDRVNGQSTQYDEMDKHIIRCFDKDARFIYQILKEIRKINPDVVHIQQELALYGNLISAFLLQILVLFLIKRKTVITLHGVVSLKKVTKEFVAENYYTVPPWIAKIGIYILFKPLTLWAHEIIVHEEYFKIILQKEYQVPADKIYVIPHGIDDIQGLSQRDARKQLSIPQSAHVILFLGYLTGYKGLDLLIDSFADYILLDKRAILFIGAGMHPKLQKDKKYKELYESFITKVAAQLPAHRYQWLGFVPEQQLPVVLTAADVAVFPYTVGMSSSGPLSLSLAYKTPVILSSAIAESLGVEFPYFERDTVSLVFELRRFFSSTNHAICRVDDVRKRRFWSEVGKKHYSLYTSRI